MRFLFFLSCVELSDFLEYVRGCSWLKQHESLKRYYPYLSSVIAYFCSIVFQQKSRISSFGGGVEGENHGLVL